MADIICRWRNPKPKTVCELVSELPKEQMSSDNFRQIMEAEFFHTRYQLACQLGLYCEDNDQYIPRFDHDISEEEAQTYLKFWIHFYYAPNPYTKSLKSLQSPVFLVKELVKQIEDTHEDDLETLLLSIFKDPMGNLDIITNVLNHYSGVMKITKKKVVLLENYKKIMENISNCKDRTQFFRNFDLSKGSNKRAVSIKLVQSIKDSIYLPYIAAIKTKPFLLLAGISGTGKSRIVRELARACWSDEENRKKQSPDNFTMIPVKPNWHDSSELIGYKSNVPKPHYVVGDFLRFIIKSWTLTKECNGLGRDIPCFLCLDEMNLAPVEQYFAEYLSCIESRDNKIGTLLTDPILEKTEEQWYYDLISTFSLLPEGLRTQFLKDGISIPRNLVVMGTVNMDETTFAFSRKVLDRAMTIEMNNVNLRSGIGEVAEQIPNLSENGISILGERIKAEDIYNGRNQEEIKTMNQVLGWLQIVNDKLEGTPFKIAYRTRNEIILYVINSVELGKDKLTAFDEAVNMKILPRIEGDANKVGTVLDDLKSVIESLHSASVLQPIETEDAEGESIKEKPASISSSSLKKLKEMKHRMMKQYYCTYWS